MKFRKEEKRGFVIISLFGDMEVYDAEDLENILMNIIKKGQKNIIIDFKRLEYISSSGLRALLNIKSHLDKQGGRLFLTSLENKVLEVFRLSRLIDVFEVYKDVNRIIERIDV